MVSSFREPVCRVSNPASEVLNPASDVLNPTFEVLNPASGIPNSPPGIWTQDSEIPNSIEPPASEISHTEAVFPGSGIRNSEFTPASPPPSIRFRDHQ